MNILYLSSHYILRHDEVDLLQELGHKVYSPLAREHDEFVNGAKDLRPLVGDFEELFEIYPSFGKELIPPDLPSKFLDPFDLIISANQYEWIIRNREFLNNKQVWLRTLGQSGWGSEMIYTQLRRAGVKIIRYSEAEQRIGKYAGHDAIVPFYKDPDIFKGWDRKNNSILTVCQKMFGRSKACCFNSWDKSVDGFNHTLVGPGNDDVPAKDGRVVAHLNYEDLIKTYQEHAVYLYTNTYPAQYTLSFIEAWMTGIPVVAFGKTFCEQKEKAYAVPDLIQHGINGFVEEETRNVRRRLIEIANNQPLAKQIGDNGRVSAIGYFGKERIKALWASLLSQI